MKDELISFETAKLAKEKGFRIYTNNVYDFKGRLNTMSLIRSVSESIAAPTQSLLQRWLREVHGLELYTQTSIGKSYHIYAILTPGASDWLDGEVKVINKHFKTYEESIEVGLLEALKIIDKSK